MASHSASGPSRRAAISFTGGKDSCTVLHLIRAPEVALRASEGWANEAWRSDLRERLAQLAGCEVTLLVTFVPAGGKQPFKAHPLEVVQLQARALGLPHLVMEVEAAPTFLDSYRANMGALRERHGVDVLATGDILDVCSNFMPRAAEGSGVQLLSPLFGVPRGLLLELVWAYGMAPLITCVNVTKFATTGSEGGQQRTAAEATDAAADSSVAEAQSQGSAETIGVQARGEGAGDAGQRCSAPAQAPSCPATATAEVSAGLDGAAAPPAPLLGLRVDRTTHRDVLLPAVQQYGIDECGEWGEYHTMVTGSVLFSAPLRLTTQARREGDYAYLSVTSADLEELNCR